MINIDLDGWAYESIGQAVNTKFADSHDQFSFYFKKIDPRKENFRLCATFMVVDAAGVDYQTGYGIMVADTVANPSKSSRHRNHALLGRFRTADGCNYGLGLRVVGGYTNANAFPQRGKRILDPSRLFDTQPEEDAIKAGDSHRFMLCKDDNGITATLYTETGEEEIRFPGIDFLLKQDRRSIYVGFAFAGKPDLTVTDIVFETGPGRISHTPKKAITNHFPDYPFPRNAFAEPKAPNRVSNTKMHISPGHDLSTALLSVGPGSEIILSDGIYGDGPYYIPSSASGERHSPVILRAEHPGKVIIECANGVGRLPAMTVRANYWTIEGLVFRRARSSGLFICGSHNVIRYCEAAENKDTGILICSFPGASRGERPSDNLVEFCVSHDNCDDVRCNADGFGAKLSIGKGNIFLACKSYHNIDDGFDLYTKDSLGRIGAVKFIACEAWGNGWLTGEQAPGSPARCGHGFKLGGENLQIRHKLWHCISHDNALDGFLKNSNRAAILKDCREWNNHRSR